MKIPNVPNDKLIQASGEIHPNWKSFFNQLVNVHQYHLSDEGYVLPSQNSSSITKLDNADPGPTSNFRRPQDIQKGRVIFNSETERAMVNNKGQYKELSLRNEELTTIERNAIPTADINGSWVYDTDQSKLYYGINNAWQEVSFP